MRRLTKITLGLISVGAIAGITAGYYITKYHPFNIAKKQPYNIILIISDQQAFHLQPAQGYHLPTHEELQRRGVTFNNHYTAAAMCSPSRAAFLTGTPPQVNGVTDQMEYDFIQSLNPNQPNMGSVLKSLGYRTAYFGKFEMDKNVLLSSANTNTAESIKPYGFDEFNPDGDTSGGQHQGYYDDPYFVGEAVRWLHKNASDTSKSDKPFFMVVSLLNPHDIMYADVNIPGQPQAQKPLIPALTPPPNSQLYAKHWKFTLPATLSESLTAKGMPGALNEYQQGWSTAFGFIPSDRPDMWTSYYNYYLNAIQDDDRKLQQITNTLSDMGLWKNTIVIFTADHGDMGGTHGGMRGKGPMAYEENTHIPLIIAHPDAAHGVQANALSSHLDLLPTLVGMTGMNSSMIAKLSGHDLMPVLNNPHAGLNAVRSGVLFNYVGYSTVDSDYLIKVLQATVGKQQSFPPVSQVNKSKRGFLMFVYDGRYKFARFYAPDKVNSPQTMEEIFRDNDVQLFDLVTDPIEAHNLALEPEKNREVILKMNAVLNELVAKEVGVSKT